MTKNKVRKPPRGTLRGRGDYTANEGSIPDPLKRVEAKIDHLERSINRKATVNSAASTVGRTLGNFMGQGDLGALAGSSLAKLFGHGDFEVKGNTLMAGHLPSGPTVPTFSSPGKRGVRIIEREFLGDVRAGSLSSGATLFQNSSYPIIPTDTSTFPWLSTIAGQFDQWEPNGIVFEFVPTSSDFNGSSQALGAVIMATDYDVRDAAYPSKVIMENADYAASTKPSCALLHGVECAVAERPTKVLYTYSSALEHEKRLSTLGNFQIATQGMSVTNVTLGELWISYDITFYKKQLIPHELLYLPPTYSGSGRCLVGQGLLANPDAPVLSDKIEITQPTVSTSLIVFNGCEGKSFLVTYYLEVYNLEAINPFFNYCFQSSLRFTGTTTAEPFYRTFVVRVDQSYASILLPAKGTTDSNWILNVVQCRPELSL
jgi:hypothetical protein